MRGDGTRKGQSTFIYYFWCLEIIIINRKVHYNYTFNKRKEDIIIINRKVHCIWLVLKVCGECFLGIRVREMAHVKA